MPPLGLDHGRQDWLPFSPASIVPARGCRGTLPVAADPGRGTLTRPRGPMPVRFCGWCATNATLWGRLDGQLLNLFPCHIEVAKGWRAVANLRKLRRKVRCLRTIRVLHGSLVRRKLHYREVCAIVISITALHRPARRSSTLRFCKPFVEGAVECVNIASLELNELYELHAYTSKCVLSHGAEHNERVMLESVQRSRLRRSERHQAVTHFQGPPQFAPLGSGGCPVRVGGLPRGTLLNTARRPGPGQPLSRLHFT